jgi:hypothetical protein
MINRLSACRKSASRRYECSRHLVHYKNSKIYFTAGGQLNREMRNSRNVELPLVGDFCINGSVQGKVVGEPARRHPEPAGLSLCYSPVNPDHPRIS